MNKTIYAIRDRVANDLIGNQMYLLMIFRTDAQAVRYFADAVLDDKSILNKHPTDYELLALGTISEGGDITSDTPRVVITGDTLVATQSPTLVREA